MAGRKGVSSVTLLQRILNRVLTGEGLDRPVPAPAAPADPAPARERGAEKA